MYSGSSLRRSKIMKNTPYPDALCLIRKRISLSEFLALLSWGK